MEGAASSSMVLVMVMVRASHLEAFKEGNPNRNRDQNHDQDHDQDLVTVTPSFSQGVPYGGLLRRRFEW